MLMKILAVGRTTSLEQYRGQVKQRVRIFWGLFLLGLLTLSVTLFLMGGRVAEADDTAYRQGVWCGIGTALLVAGPFLALRTRKLLKDEEALRKSMLEEQDERNIAINQRAVGLATGVGLVVIYLAMLVYSFIDRTVFQTLCYCAAGFLVLLVAARGFYSRRM